MCLTALYPPFAIAGICLTGGGCYGAYKCIIGATKFNKLFMNLKLGVNEEYPIFKMKKHTDYSTVYTFTLPTGLSSEDFKSKQLAIEEYLGKSVEIKYTYKELYIEVFEEEMKHYYEYYLLDIKGDVPILIRI
jgi:S-DNA-T family DNA segregation ATPase FtsK/SpoIIIE